MTRLSAVKQINAILSKWGWNMINGHSFRIGGASHYLAQGVSPEVVRLHGRWRSLAYQARIRTFEQKPSRYLSGKSAQAAVINSEHEKELG